MAKDGRISTGRQPPPVENDPFMWLANAASFLDAAIEVEKANPRGILPIRFLLGFSVELAIKAFLVSRGYSIKKLTDIGHDLRRAMRDANRAGLPHIADDAKDVFRLLAKSHKELEFRYPKKAVLESHRNESVIAVADVILCSVALELGPPPEQGPP